MRSLKEVEKVLKENRKELKRRFGVRKIGIFGSYASGKANNSSDIDILVDIERPSGIFELMELQDYLAKLLGRKIDITTSNSLKPLIKKEILSQTVYV